MFYNLLNYTDNTNSQNRTNNLKTILEETKPDLFMVCELKNENASNYIFNNAILTVNSDFNKAKFEVAQSPAKGLQQMVYFNSKKLNLANSKVITTSLRDINRYTFTTNTANPVTFEVFVTHLKASSDSESRQKRLLGVNKFVAELATLPTDAYVLFAGDFNFYTSNEAGYLKILDSNNTITMVDPIDTPCPAFPDDGRDYFENSNPRTYNQYFWNNASFASVHSQSTRTTSFGGGARGGMDDRFDFIMMSDNFNTSADFYYLDNSYKTIGNNGNCYNSYVSDVNCSGEYSQTLRDALHNFSDHLPIYMEIETPENTLSTEDYAFATTVQGNMVTNFLNLKLKTPSKNLYIYNNLGQQVLEINSANKTSLRIPINNLSKGVYYLKSKQHHKPLKFIKI